MKIGKVKITFHKMNEYALFNSFSTLKRKKTFKNICHQLPIMKTKI